MIRKPLQEVLRNIEATPLHSWSSEEIAIGVSECLKRRLGDVSHELDDNKPCQEPRLRVRWRGFVAEANLKLTGMRDHELKEIARAISDDLEAQFEADSAV